MGQTDLRENRRDLVGTHGTVFYLNPPVKQETSALRHMQAELDKANDSTSQMMHLLNVEILAMSSYFAFK